MSRVFRTVNEYSTTRTEIVVWNIRSREKMANRLVQLAKRVRILIQQFDWFAENSFYYRFGSSNSLIGRSNFDSYKQTLICFNSFLGVICSKLERKLKRIIGGDAVKSSRQIIPFLTDRSDRRNQWIRSMCHFATRRFTLSSLCRNLSNRVSIRCMYVFRKSNEVHRSIMKHRTNHYGFLFWNVELSKLYG